MENDSFSRMANNSPIMLPQGKKYKGLKKCPTINTFSAKKIRNTEISQPSSHMRALDTPRWARPLKHRK